jgi:hypothetical protein
MIVSPQASQIRQSRPGTPGRGGESAAARGTDIILVMMPP